MGVLAWWSRLTVTTSLPGTRSTSHQACVSQMAEPPLPPAPRCSRQTTDIVTCGCFGKAPAAAKALLASDVVTNNGGNAGRGLHVRC